MTSHANSDATSFHSHPNRDDDSTTDQSAQQSASTIPGATTAVAPITPSASAYPADNENAAQGPHGQSASSASTSSKLSSLKVKLSSSLRQYPDFPSPGILFEDIMPLFASPSLLRDLIDALELFVLESFSQNEIPDVIVGLDARGFLIGPALALRLNCGFVPVRKKGKLPGECETVAYEKEYGMDYFEIQKDGVKRGEKVVVLDDIIATGGSAAAAGELVNKLGGHLLGFVFLLELDFLKGRDKLQAPVYTLLSSQKEK